MKKNWKNRLVGMAGLAMVLTPIANAVSAQVSIDERPNVVMIVIDDLRRDEFGAGGHPYLKTPAIDSIAENGAKFNNAYHNTPLCSPNRATILTGQYGSRHGIVDNTDRALQSHRLEFFSKELQKAGYTTAHVGKWHMGKDPSQRPGYDYWVSYPGQGQSLSPTLYENGKMVEYKGEYMTDLLTTKALDFIDNASDGDKPFFVTIAHKAVHPDMRQLSTGEVDPTSGNEFVPAQRHKGVYADKNLKRAPSVGRQEADLAGKKMLQDALAMRDALKGPILKFLDPGPPESTLRARAEMVLAIDENVQRVLDDLKEKDILDNTMVIFTSDNGYWYGEHDLSVERRAPYQEAIRAPLLIQYPDKIQPGIKINGYAESSDYSATILDAAGFKTLPNSVQGMSLMPMLTGEKENIRDSAYIEFYSHNIPQSWMMNADYRAVVMGDYKFIKFMRHDDADELYNLKNDPYEMNNIAKDPDMASVLKKMKEELNQRVLYAGGFIENPYAVN